MARGALKGISRPIAVHRVAARGAGRHGRRARSRRASCTPMVDRVERALRLTEAWRRASSGPAARSSTSPARRGSARAGWCRPCARTRATRGSGERIAAVLAAPREHRPVPGDSLPRPSCGPRARAVAGGSASRRSSVPSRPPSSTRPRPCRCSRISSRSPGADARAAAAAARRPQRDAAHRSRRYWSATPLAIRCCSSWRTCTGPTRRRVSCSSGSSRSIEDMPVACVLTFRDEFEPPWTPWQRCRDRRWTRCRGRRVAAMAAAASSTSSARTRFAGSSRPPTACRCSSRRWSRRCRSDAEREEPVRRRGDSTVPPTLQGLLAERLDRLPELAEVIDLAAVLGREFDRDAAASAQRRPTEPGFRSAVAQLDAEDVLRPVEGSRSRLEFKHALLQEAAYDRLLRRRRRELHARVAELLAERSAPGRRIGARADRLPLVSAGSRTRRSRTGSARAARARSERRSSRRPSTSGAALEALDEARRRGRDGARARRAAHAARARAAGRALRLRPSVHEIYARARAG